MVKKSYMLFPLVFFIFINSLHADPLQDNLKKLGFTLIEQEINYFDFSLADASGRKINLKDYQGKIIFLNFWATWCPPCRSEMPSMELLNKKMAGKKFVMIAVNIQEDSKTVESFIKKNNYNFLIALDESGAVSAKYKIQAIPTTYIIDAKGKIKASFTGSKNWGIDEIVSVFSEIAK